MQYRRLENALFAIFSLPVGLSIVSYNTSSDELGVACSIKHYDKKHNM